MKYEKEFLFDEMNMLFCEILPLFISMGKIIFFSERKSDISSNSRKDVKVLTKFSIAFKEFMLKYIN